MRAALKAFESFITVMTEGMELTLFSVQQEENHEISRQKAADAVPEFLSSRVYCRVSTIMFCLGWDPGCRCRTVAVDLSTGL